jgi:hypothetical protein
MKSLLKTLLYKIEGFKYRRGIKQALALNLRGEFRKDGLTLSKAGTSLAIEWYARDIHPWDRDRNLSPDEREHLFLQQCLADTEDAISLLFAELPRVDHVDVCVLEPTSKKAIVAGSVSRASLERSDRLSVGMRLRLSGVTFRLWGWHLETLELREGQYQALSGFADYS